MPFHKREFEVIRNLGGEYVLELGAGSGYTLARLCELFPKIVAIEPDLDIIFSPDSVWRSEKASEFLLCAASGLGLPFDDNIFDGVISHWALHHYRYPLMVLNEAHRVLKPNGWLYTADGIECDKSLATKAQRNHIDFHRIAVAIDRICKKDHFPFKNVSNTEQLLEHSGFEEVKSEIIFEEDNAEPLDEYVSGYIQRLEGMAERISGSAETEAYLSDILGLIEAVKKDGISPAPFACIVSKAKKYDRRSK